MSLKYLFEEVFDFELVVKFIIFGIVCYFVYRLYKKMKNKNGNNSDRNYNQPVETTQHNYQQSTEEPKTIDGTVEVDKAIVRALYYNDILGLELSRMTTSTGYHADMIFDNIRTLLDNSSEMVRQLKLNESENGRGDSIANVKGIEVEMINYDVRINVMGWDLEMSLSQLSSLNNVTDLRGQIDDNLILNQEVFRDL